MNPGSVRLQPDPWIRLCSAAFMRTGNPGHLRSFDYVGHHRYSLTFCTDERRKAFTDAVAVGLVLDQISRAAEENQFAVIAYCFMPDHLHLLVEGQAANAACKVFITKAKQYAGFYYAAAYGTRLWQRYGFEHVLRDEELTVVVARYILQNPVRASLVQRVEDYPFGGSLVYPLSDLLEGLAYRSG